MELPNTFSPLKEEIEIVRSEEHHAGAGRIPRSVVLVLLVQRAGLVRRADVLIAQELKQDVAAHVEGRRLFRIETLSETDAGAGDQALNAVELDLGALTRFVAGGRDVGILRLNLRLDVPVFCLWRICGRIQETPKAPGCRSRQRSSRRS